MIQFFAPDILKDKTLPESDSQHCTRVLRMKAGDKLEVTDGRGHRYVCEIVNPHSKRTLVEIIEEEETERPWRGEIAVAVAPTKHMDRMEWLVEKLTEIGVNRIIPMLCKHSERKEIKRERLEKIAVSAMKQSLQTHLPQIDEMTRFGEIVGEFGDWGRFMGYCDDETERTDLAECYIDTMGQKKNRIVMIGPEGDFSPVEIKEAIEIGWHPVTLGETRLRTETAALTAIETLHVVDRLLQGRSFCKR